MPNIHRYSQTLLTVKFSSLANLIQSSARTTKVTPSLSFALLRSSPSLPLSLMFLLIESLHQCLFLLPTCNDRRTSLSPINLLSIVKDIFLTASMLVYNMCHICIAKIADEYGGWITPIYMVDKVFTNAEIWIFMFFHSWTNVTWFCTKKTFKGIFAIVSR